MAFVFMIVSIVTADVDAGECDNNYHVILLFDTETGLANYYLSAFRTRLATILSVKIFYV